MSHDIERINGINEIAYIGQTPWHGLGQRLTEDAPIHVWQQEAGLNWQANVSPVAFQPTADSDFVVMKNKFVIYRNDTHAPLGVVTDRYNIHQPDQILDFFNTLVESAGFKLEVAGALRGGKRIWALANVNKEACVLGDDAVRWYLLLSTSFDGSAATIGQFTSVRVVCNNTLSMADNENAPSRVSLTHGSTFDPSAMRNRLGIVVSGFEGMMDRYRYMARQDVGTAYVEKFLKTLFPRERIGADGQLKNSRGYNKVMEIFESRGIGFELRGVRNTRWGLLNAVTQYVDHERGHNADTRLNNAWFGQGNRMKTDAEELLLG